MISPVRTLLVLAATFGVGAAMAQSLPGSDTPESRRVPVSHLVPGGQWQPPPMANPLEGDVEAAQRGMRDFNQFNCVGCHAANGAGGMGPSLSDNTWIYGDQPAQIFMSIAQGRPNGMPAFGQVLPDGVIWELVSYVRGISSDPAKGFGKTISLDPQSPEIEQTPAEANQTASPWDSTERFHNGQKP